MRIRILMSVCCLCIAWSLLMYGFPVTASAADEDLEETIAYLVRYVRTSDVTFIRNNKEHAPEDAAEHILKKYNHYKKKIKTPEDFIRLSATKSMMSGREYTIRTPEGVTMTSAQWLTQALEEYRSAGSRSGRSREISETQAYPQNPECPDSSRYEVRTIERESGDCTDPETDCVTVSFRYPEIAETPFVGAEYEVNTRILEAMLKAPSDDIYLENLEAVTESFFLEHRSIKQDMPDYATSWFLERDVAIVHNGSDIISLASSEIIYTGGAHPNSSTHYASIDLSTGERLSLDDILVEGHEDRLTQIGEGAFRALKQIPADQGLLAAGFWFEDDRFRLNDNFAITTEGIAFYFNNYEIASYADGPTRLVIETADLKPLIRKDRLEWFSQDR